VTPARSPIGQDGGVLHYEVCSDDADPDLAWALFAQPARWSAWAPHLRGAWGLGSPEVEVGRSGAVRLLGAIPVPVTIVAKDAERRSWTWRVGLAVAMEHRVQTHPGGPTTLSVTIRAPAPLEAALRVSYGPLIEVLLARLSRSATARRPPTGTGSPGG
jgi:hypothetical protein